MAGVPHLVTEGREVSLCVWAHRDETTGSRGSWP